MSTLFNSRPTTPPAPPVLPVSPTPPRSDKRKELHSIFHDCNKAELNFNNLLIARLTTSSSYDYEHKLADSRRNLIECIDKLNVFIKEQENFLCRLRLYPARHPSSLLGQAAEKKEYLETILSKKDPAEAALFTPMKFSL